MPRFVAAFLPLMVLALPACARAHVIPLDAQMQVFLKPEGRVLRVLVRVPLETMVDLPYPTRGTDELLDLDRADRVLRELAALWIADNLQAYEGNRPLPRPQVVEVRASLAFDGSFASYERALAHVLGPRLTNSVDFVWNQGHLDALLESPIESERSRFSLHSKLSTLALRTTTTLRFVQPDGQVRGFEFAGDRGPIVLDPTWSQTAVRFITTGFLGILRDTEAWLFLFVLVLPLRGLRALVPVAIAFGVGQAITLSPSSSFAPDALWFEPLVGLLIAAAILFMAIENGIGAGVQRRWMMAFGFGLLIGFRFSFALRDTLQFAGSHTWTSLAAFGVAVAAAQILLLLLFVPTARLVFRIVPERAGMIVLSLMAGDIAWHWMGSRAALVRQYQFQWPATTPALTLALVNWAMNLVIAAAVFWLLLTAIRRFDTKKVNSRGGRLAQSGP